MIHADVCDEDDRRFSRLRERVQRFVALLRRVAKAARAPNKASTSQELHVTECADKVMYCARRWTATSQEKKQED